MKQYVLALAVCVGSACYVQAQIQLPQASPAATVSQMVGLAKVTVEYSRPALKGRRMFGERIPFGKVWRTGANQTTKLTFSDAVTLNGQPVAAGSYGLHTIPTAGDWTIILSKDANAWGSYSYDPQKDALRFTVRPERSGPPTEHFTIEFTDFTPTTANLALRWENVVVKIPVKQDPDARIMAQIQEQTARADAKPGTLMAAANYYYDTNRDLKQALTWADKVVETEKQYWTYHLRAKIQAKLGNCAAARNDAQQSIELARKAGDDAYVKNNEQLLAQCK